MIEMRPGRCVYVLEAGEFHKIGMASDIRARFGQIQTCSPFECKLAHIIYVRKNRLVEQKLHRWLAAYRVRGEWFRIPAPHMEALRKLTTEWFSQDAASPFGDQAAIAVKWDGPPTPASTFPRRLREARRRRNWSLKRVSRIACVSLGFLAKVERGEKRPSLSTLDALALTFDSSLTGDQIMYTTWPD